VQEVADERQNRCFTSDLSALGVYLEKPLGEPSRKRKTVQLEIPLPNRNDSIWAAGEVIYDCSDPLFQGTAVRFTNMARIHQRMLRDWLRETKRTRQAGVPYPFRARFAEPSPSA
jgi:hypothetical protein